MKIKNKQICDDMKIIFIGAFTTFVSCVLGFFLYWGIRGLFIKLFG